MSEQLRIMIGCAARRVYLLDYFRQAGADLGVSVRLDITENDPYAAAGAYADHLHLLPRFDDPTYPQRWREAVDQARPHLYLSVNDYEIDYLSRRADLTDLDETIAIPRLTPEVFTWTLDKVELARRAREAGVATATTATLDECEEILATGTGDEYVVKDRFGSGSSGLRFLTGEGVRALRATHPDPTSLVVQPRLVGSEYGMDVVSALRGRGEFRAALVREKLAMRSGETDRARTVDPGTFTDIAKRLSEFLGAQGSIDTDVFLTEDGPVLIDINPRFGGGYPFSHAAGANVPRAYLRELRGDGPNADDYTYESGVCAAKFPQIAVVSGAKSPH